MKTITLTNGIHKGNKVVFLSFEKDNDLISVVKTIKGSRWSASNVKWYIPEESFEKSQLFRLFKGKAWLNYSGVRVEAEAEVEAKVEAEAKAKVKVKREALPVLSHDMMRKIEEFRRWMEHKRYSGQTIKTYIESLKIFLKFVQPPSVREIKNDDVVFFVS